MPGPSAGVELLVHGTLVTHGGDGVLLRGIPGAGKSDLALRLLAAPWQWLLVSDDQVLLERAGDTIVGRAPATIAGKLEVRGIGIVTVAVAPTAVLRVVIDLVPRPQVPRMPPDNATTPLLGLDYPQFWLHAFDASAPDKVRLMLASVTGVR